MSDPIKIDGEFGFTYENGKLNLSARDVVIDGLPIQNFGWEWFALSVASGILSALGGMVFSAVLSAVRNDSGTDMSEMLKQQLEASYALGVRLR